MSSDAFAEGHKLSELDRLRLDMAQLQAEAAVGLSDPNPRVGCILGLADGTVLGVGSTQKTGEAHAEVMALRQAAASGADLRGASAWVTLEPCSHHGRTPPCCEALIRAGLSRVVVGERDPNPLVAGQGISRMRAAGIQVDMGHATHAAATRELNIGFFSRHERGRPWVRMKLAASLDGRTALPDGSSQWITSEAARTDGHRWRRRASAIVTGIGTVLADDPRLDVRLAPSFLQPTRVVIDSKLRLPISARLLQPPGQSWVATAASAPRDRLATLSKAGVDVRVFAENNHQVDLAAVLRMLADGDANEIHIEAGAGLNGALLNLGFVDEVLLYVAPMLVGDGPGLALLSPIASLSQALRFNWVETACLGHDLRVRLRPATGTRGLPSRREP